MILQKCFCIVSTIDGRMVSNFPTKIISLACLPKDKYACTDEEIIRFRHAIYDSTYYLIHRFNTSLQYITSFAVCRSFLE